MQSITESDLAAAVERANAFWASSPESIHDQVAVCAALGKSLSWAERSRWQGGGPRFIRVGRHVRYRKSDVVAWIEQQPAGTSTSQLPAAA
jgi:predicted DNA-binding transcriptional regulator AlpA